MEIAILIDSVIGQTMKLVAKFATNAGTRAPLAHIQDQIFLMLVTELKSQGVSQKVIANMFGMARRSYHAKVRRLTNTGSALSVTLWKMLHDRIIEEEPVTRGALLEHFRFDDVMTVRGVLNELVNTGVVFKTGRGPQTVYRTNMSSGTVTNKKELTDLLDHYEAMVSVLTKKLDPPRQDLCDSVGGSTYNFAVWDEHPEREVVVDFLADTRTRAAELRHKVQQYNDLHEPDSQVYRVVFYAGQNVMEPGDQAEG